MTAKDLHAGAMASVRLSGPHAVACWPGLDVYYAPFSFADSLVVADETDRARRVALVIVLGLVNEHGSRFFGEADVPEVMLWDRELASDLFLAISKHAGLFADAEETAAEEAAIKKG